VRQLKENIPKVIRQSLPVFLYSQQQAMSLMFGVKIEQTIKAMRLKRWRVLKTLKPHLLQLVLLLLKTG
jgi:hypothetical protein